MIRVIKSYHDKQAIILEIKVKSHENILAVIEDTKTGVISCTNLNKMKALAPSEYDACTIKRINLLESFEKSAREFKND